MYSIIVSLQRKRFNFTAKDIHRCLYGKQEMRIVNIDDAPSNPNNNNDKTPCLSGPEAGALVKMNGSSNPEDKNKPAKCKLTLSWALE